MDDLAPKPTAPTDTSQIAHLKREDARIRLQWANVASQGSVVVLFAPSVAGHEQLLKAAVYETHATATFIDVTSLLDMSGHTEMFHVATAVLVFDDPAFREAPFALHQLVNARKRRKDIHPLIVRVGSPQEEDDDLEAHLVTGETLQINNLEEWRQVPVFLMEGFFKQASRKKTGH
jgi:hypothetical protein